MPAHKINIFSPEGKNSVFVLTPQFLESIPQPVHDIVVSLGGPPL